MALFRKFFYKKPPDGLLEISESVYVFDYCFSRDVLEEEEYKVYILGIIGQLHGHFPDSSFMVFNFREGDHQSQIARILCDYDMTIIEYPRQYEGCPILTMETIHHFLRSGESWYQLGQNNIILMHCERGGWPVLAFMLAALLIYRKQYTGEQKTLDMIFKQAPRELLQLMSPLNPLPSQLRYLQYVSRRNVGSQWPPLDRALTLDCVIMRLIPNTDGEGGCRPIFRIYGQDPFMVADRTPKVLFSTPKRRKDVRYYKQADSELVKIDIRCHVQGDVVLECISLDSDLEHEQMMFRIMFNTAFIRSNILMLNRDEIDTLWNGKDQFPKDFRVEIFLSDMDASSSIISIDMPRIEDKDGLPIEAFAKAKEIFSNVDWLDPKTEVVNVLQQITASNKLQEILDCGVSSRPSNLLKDSLSGRSKFDPITLPENDISSMTSTVPVKDSMSYESSVDLSSKKEMEPLETKVLSENNKITISLCRGKRFISSLELSTDSNLTKKIISLESKALLENDTENRSLPLELPMDPTLMKKKIEEIESKTLLETRSMEKEIKPLESKALPGKDTESLTSTAQAKESILSHKPSDDANSVEKRIETSETMALSDDNTTHDKSKKSLVSSPAPMPSLPEAIKSSISTPSHPTAAPPPSSTKSSFSTPTSPPPAFPPPSSFPETTSHSTVKSSFKAPPPPPPYPTAASLLSSSSTKGSLSTLPPPTPPPPPPSSSPLTSHSTVKSLSPPSPAPAPPSLSSSSRRSPHSRSENSLEAPPLPPPPPPPPPPLSSTAKTSSIPPPPLSGIPASAAHVNPSPLNVNNSAAISGPPPPPPPPGYSGTMSGPTLTSTVPLPPPPPASHAPTLSKNPATVPPVPPPPSANGLSEAGTLHPSTANGNVPPAPGPPGVPVPPGVPFGANGRGLSRSNSKLQKRSNLKPYHWLKLTRAMHGSLWAETQKPEEASKAPEFDMSELESLFSAAAPNSYHGGKGGKSNRRAPGTKNEKVQLIELRRAYNCEIMLTQVKIPLPDLMSSVLALDDSALDADQVENLLKFCPTKEEMELLRTYTGDKDNLGRCEQFFLELMKVPRVESKLRVFCFKIQFSTQVSELRRDLNIVKSASEEIRNSVKLKRIMQTILSLGNALNHGTARGAAIGFRLDSLLKLTDTRARNNKMTLMHYLCKVLAEKLPELLDFSKDLESLEASTKIQLKYLAEEMQTINKGLEKVVQELTVSENDGLVSENFCKILKEFLSDAEAEVRSLAQLYSNVGRNADALAQYFGEDPARCPFEQVVSTLLNFVRMFGRAHEDNCKQIEFEKKKATKEAENEKLKLTPKKQSEQMIRTPIESGNIK